MSNTEPTPDDGALDDAAPGNLVTFKSRAQLDFEWENSSAVQRLEELLERAKSGEIKGIAAAVVWTNDSVSTCFSRGSFSRLAGAVALLQHRIIDHID
jgi:hypothetical protein